MSSRKGNRTFSSSYGQFWFGGTSFPGFLYKRNLGVGSRRSTQFVPGGSRVSNQTDKLWNNYTPGAGVGGSSIATRRAKMLRSTACVDGHHCSQYQLRPSIYNNPSF